MIQFQRYLLTHARHTRYGGTKLRKQAYATYIYHILRLLDTQAIFGQNVSTGPTIS